jgi:hypothetical protein
MSESLIRHGVRHAENMEQLKFEERSTARS